MRKLTALLFAALFLVTALLVCGCAPVEEPPAPAPCTHEYGEWQETTPATLLADGKCTRTCTLCGETEEKAINRKYLVTLATSNTEYGSVSGAPDGGISWGESVTVVATPSDVGGFLGWYEGETKVSDEASYTFTMPQRELSLTAKFAYTAWEGNTATAFAGGSGTETDPYLISNGAELAYLSALLSDPNTAPNYKNKHFALTANINLTGNEWKPIGPYQVSGGTNEDMVFSGYFDGRGHTVRNFKITRVQRSTDAYFGLFGRVEGTIYNLHIADAEINLNFSPGTSVRAGLLVGMIRNGGLVGCSATGKVEVKTQNNHAIFVGGLAGTLYQSNATRCSFVGRVNAYNNYTDVTHFNYIGVGGLIGSSLAEVNDPETPYEIKDCYAITQSVYGACPFDDAFVGGILGYGHEYTTNVVNCYHVGRVSGDAEYTLTMGGIAGQAYLTKNCYFKGGLSYPDKYNYELNCYLGVGSIRNGYSACIYVEGGKTKGGRADSSSTSYETAVELTAADFVTHFTETMALDASIWDLSVLDFDNAVYPTLKPLS